MQHGMPLRVRHVTQSAFGTVLLLSNRVPPNQSGGVSITRGSLMCNWKCTAQRTVCTLHVVHVNKCRRPCLYRSHCGTFDCMAP